MDSIPQKQLAIRIKGVPSFAELLYFDEITILGFDFNLGRISDEEASQLNYLETNGVIKKQSHFDSHPKAASIFTAELEKLIKDFDEMVRFLTSEIERRKRVSLTNEKTKSASQVNSSELMQEFQYRIEMRISEPLRQAVSYFPEYEATSIFSIQPDSANGSNKNSVFQITLNKFPIPLANTPLEKVLEFRSDRVAMEARRRLQRWMRKISEQNLKPKQIEDEIQELIEQYTEHMRLYRMKYHTSALHGLFTASLGAFENAVRFKFTDALNALFTVRTNQLALTEAEMKSPGRQVAYIVQAREKFTR